MKDIFLADQGAVITRYDAAVVRDEASFAREFGNKNGFSNGRTMRRIGAIPLSEFLAMEMAAGEAGDVLSKGDILAYLDRHPEYRTVRRINSGQTGRIRVK